MNLFVEERLILHEIEQFRKCPPMQNMDIPQDIQKCLFFIKEHFYETWLDVNAVKLHCQMKNNNISCRFRFHTGSCLCRYIEDCRLQAALHLLKFPALRVYMIALNIGYTHPESFTRAFRRRLGYPPSIVRRFCLQHDFQATTAQMISPAESMRNLRLLFSKSLQDRSLSPTPEEMSVSSGVPCKSCKIRE